MRHRSGFRFLLGDSRFIINFYTKMNDVFISDWTFLPTEEKNT